MRTLRPVAAYLSGPQRRVGHKPKVIQLVGALAAFAMVMVIFVFSMGLNPSIVLADDGSEDGFDSTALESTMDGSDPELLNDYLDQYKDGVNNDTFQYVIGRLLTPQYINYLPDASVSGSTQAQATKIGYAPNGGMSYSNYVCHDNQTGAGTPVYHNCDVPNFMGQFVQNLYALFDRSGAQNATAINAVGTLFPSFGQSKGIPGDAVPIDPSSATAKYTALELYGYDLQVSSYLGEWDHIQTLNSARLLTNFSFFDSVSLTAKTIGNAIGGAFTTAGTMAAEGWNTGGIFGAIGGFFSGLFEGGASGAMNTLLDTSDANVVLSYGWFRVNYGATSYGLREMSGQEIAAQIRAAFLSYMNSSMPKNETYDEWLKSTDPAGAIMGKGPEKAISKCEVYENTGSGNTLVEITSRDGNDNTKAPGVSETSCLAEQRVKNTARFDQLEVGTWVSGTSYAGGAIVYYGGTAYQNKNSTAVSGTTGPSSDTGNWKSVSRSTYSIGTAVWSVDGTKKAESFNTWYGKAKETAGDWDANLSTYGFALSAASCTPANADSTEGDQPQTAYTDFIANCWSPAWSEAAHDNEVKNQSTRNTGWLESLLNEAVLARWTQDNPDVFDFNSPWKRYICLNADGTDVTNGFYNDTISGGDQGTPILVKAFDKNGNVNSLCPQASYRAPIQGGLFGDGYDPTQSNQNPGNDTRHISNYLGVNSIAIYPFFLQPLGNISQGMMTIGQFATQISNEFITWTYSPILDAIGIKTPIISLIDGMRDSIFFPLAALVAAFAGLYILYQAGVRRRYREMFVSAGLLALTFILGAVLMMRTADVVNFIDRAPSNVEKALLSLILGPVVDDDKMCSADSSAAPTGTGEADWDSLDLGASSSSVTDVNGLFDDGYDLSDDPIREVLCANWKAFVYYPWVYSQWGTSPGNLDDSKMLNTNESLVGTAEVDMGGADGIVNNWGLYQLDSMKLGSSTTINANLTGFKLQSKDFYRIVDMQAGPNNGAGTDSRYLNSWSGMNPTDRLGVGFMSMVVAIFGAVTIIAYSFTKIIITLVSVLMLIFIPFVFLLGMFPPRRKFVKEYVMTIVSLCIQRIALMIVVAIFISLLMSVLGTANDYASVFLTAIVICIVFLKFRGPIMKLALSSGGAGSGAFANLSSKATNWGTGMAGLDGVKGLEKSWSQTDKALGGIAPKSLANFAERRKEELKYGASGAIAGIAMGAGAKKGFEIYAQPRVSQINRKQRRMGYGFLEGTVRTAQEVSETIKVDSRKDVDFMKAMDELQGQLPAFQKYAEDLDKYKDQETDFYRAHERVGGSWIEEEEYDDENGQRQVARKLMVEVPPADETQNSTKDVLITLKPPTPPKADGKALKLDDMAIAYAYRDAKVVETNLINSRSEYREQLYTSGGPDSPVAKLTAASTQADVTEAINATFTDEAGFTNVSRQRAGKIVKDLDKIEKDLDKVRETLSEVEQRYREKNAEDAFKNSPAIVMKNIVGDVDKSIEDMENSRRNKPQEERE